MNRTRRKASKPVVDQPVFITRAEPEPFPVCLSETFLDWLDAQPHSDQHPLSTSLQKKTSILVNYAAGDKGGEVYFPEFKCGWDHNSVWFYILGFAYTYKCVNEPFNMLTDSLEYGDCFSVGKLPQEIGIRLRDEVVVEGVRIGHIDKQESGNDGKTAPRKFEVFGIANKTFTKLLFGTYDLAKGGIQEFPIPFYRKKRRYKRVVLRVLSNYGDEATCVYNFGILAE